MFCTFVFTEYTRDIREKGVGNDCILKLRVDTRVLKVVINIFFYIMNLANYLWRLEIVALRANLFWVQRGATHETAHVKNVVQDCKPWVITIRSNDSYDEWCVLCNWRISLAGNSRLDKSKATLPAPPVLCILCLGVVWKYVCRVTTDTHQQ